MMLPRPLPLCVEREPLRVAVSLVVSGHSTDWLIDIWLISKWGIGLLQHHQPWGTTDVVLFYCKIIDHEILLQRVLDKRSNTFLFESI